MSPCIACASQTSMLFPELFPEPESSLSSSEELLEDGDPLDDILTSQAETRPSDTDPLAPEELTRLALDFVRRSEALIDVVAPPAWEDEDDLFRGEVFEDERLEYLQMSSSNLSEACKENLVRQLMANEAARYPGCGAVFLIALALTYRRILLDVRADPRDKLEVLRRVYTTHEPEWMTAEIVYLHFILLDQCRYLARPTASVERKEETLRWIFTDPVLEDRPFSFKNCVRLVTGNAPELGAVYQRLKEELRPILSAWLRESLGRKRTGDDRQPELFES